MVVNVPRRPRLLAICLQRGAVVRTRSRASWVVGISMLVVGGSATQALCQGPTAGEQAQARRWVAAKFEGVAVAPRPEPGLIVLANNDPVQLNARGGRPLKIAETQYTRGLYCHAVSKVIVRLPGPAQRFEAVAGSDNNEQTSGGRGSIIFGVRVGEEERFRSPVLHDGDEGVPVNVELGGAAELVLEVEDAGDGISCDQADWAEARVTVQDGRTVRLGDLPFAQPSQEPDATPPFSFTYGGQSWAALLPGWKLERTQRELDAQRTEHTLTYTDPATGLVVRCVAIEYHDYPTVEWTLYLRNDGTADTPIIADLQALDTQLARDVQGEFVLHHYIGSICTQEDYKPIATTLGPNTEQRIVPDGGRGSNGQFPYFNIEAGAGGTIVVVGWPGQWCAQFTRDGAMGLRVRAGQELTHFKLLPGEEVRTPLIVLQFWQGDRLRAQNTFRRWMIAHNLPRPGGQVPTWEFAACSSHQYGEMISADSASQKMFIDRYLDEGLKLDYWWMDAGWYWNKGGWPNTGTWEVDTDRFPGGFRPITDHAHERGVKIIVWFEPERVTPGTWLYDQHPEWLLGPDGGQKLLNLGTDEARAWLTDHVDRLLTDEGIDLYRQDFNMDPLGYWRANDAEDRQGITEIRHITGYLAYWDELRRRHPNMLIDSCASGGRRNDLETMRRAVPLLRSDYILEPVGQQCHTYGLASWLPFYGTGVNTGDPYVFRSQMCPHLTGCWDMRVQGADYTDVRQRIAEWREVAPYWQGDYYPLTPYSTDNSDWMAWQFDRPDLGGGVVQAFRRADSIYLAARLRLHGLDPEARYALRDLNAGELGQRTGRELMDTGLEVRVEQQPGAVIVRYERM